MYKDRFTESSPKILHDGNGNDGGVAKCGVNYFEKDRHGWIDSDDKHVIDKCGSASNRKLCEDCYVGEHITEFNNG